MTQEELAHEASVDRSYLSELERDLKSPTVDFLIRLCKAMDASAGAIVTQVEQKQKSKSATRRPRS